MYFDDLSKYAYIRHVTIPMVNVGWLSPENTYAKGETSPVFHDYLFQLCRYRQNETMGWHQCELCVPIAPSGQGFKVSRNGIEIELASAEIHVQGQDGKIYSAPNLIYHYVVDHGYCPPDGFIEAVLKSKGQPFVQEQRREQKNWFQRMRARL